MRMINQNIEGRSLMLP